MRRNEQAEIYRVETSTGPRTLTSIRFLEFVVSITFGWLTSLTTMSQVNPAQVLTLVTGDDIWLE